MGFLGQTYDADEIPEGKGFDLLPTGWYSAEIRKAEVKPTKDGTGTRLNVQFKITDSPDGKWIGRVVFAGLNIELPNSSEGQRIGKEQFGDLLRSCGLGPIDDSDELVGHNVRIRVKQKAAQDGYEANNEVSGYRPLEGAPESAAKPGLKSGPAAAARLKPGMAPKPTPTAARNTPAAGGVKKKPMPWDRKK